MFKQLICREVLTLTVEWECYVWLGNSSSCLKPKPVDETPIKAIVRMQNLMDCR